MEKIQDWIIEFFSIKNDLSKYDKSKLLEVNYFEENFIDSFGIIELVMKIESEFKIKIPSDAFQERKFSTIRGLAEIIKQQMDK